MRQVVMHGPGDVRVEDREDPRIIEPTDAILRLAATCICGSDLWPYRGAEPVNHQVMGHEYVGVVEEVGSEVRTVKVGDFVVGSFWASDKTCEICEAVYQSHCVHAVLMGTIGTQAEYARVPFADTSVYKVPEELTDERFGLPTVLDILAELEKPARDPRPEFVTAAFQEGIESLADLKAGMVLEGVVTNVAAFGAFVDVGVHQDGLVHVSALAKRFVKDPHEVVKAGQIVKVKVIEVDAKRQRIALTMRLDDGEGASARQAPRERAPSQERTPSHERKPNKRDARPDTRRPQTRAPELTGAMAQAFAKLKK